MTEREFIDSIAPLAQTDMQQSGILASVTIAQACLESAYGTSDLAAKARNLFGMKCVLSENTWTSVWDGVTEYQKRTREQDTSGKEHYVTARFRWYPDIAASIRDHSLYLLQAAMVTGSDTRDCLERRITVRPQSLSDMAVMLLTWNM